MRRAMRNCGGKPLPWSPTTANLKGFEVGPAGSGILAESFLSGSKDEFRPSAAV
jgi:hypothetical protein